MRPHPAGQPMVDGADVEVDRLERAEGALDLGEALVGKHGGGGIGGQAPAPRCAGRRSRRAPPPERSPLHPAGTRRRVSLGDGGPGRCSATLRRPSTAPTLRAISASPRSGLRARVVAASILADRPRWRRAGLRACPRDSATRFEDPADDQSFAREIGRADLGNVLLVEQRQLQRPALVGEHLNGGPTEEMLVIQSSAAGFSSSSILALVIMPRSPTNTTRFNRSVP